MTACGRGTEHVTTARLQLDRLTSADLDDHHALHADPRVWLHFPSGRHESRADTEVSLAAMAEMWERVGAGYWSVRLREPVGELGAGAYVGVAGCAVRAGTTWWNLYYRFLPEAGGHGLAQEAARAAVAGAHAVDESRPVVAYLLESNAASRRTAERCGLRLIWRGPEPDHTEPGAVRLVLADRPLTAATLSAALDHYRRFVRSSTGRPRPAGAPPDRSR